MAVNYTCKTSKELKSVIKNNTIVVLKLGAQWCQPCKEIAPMFNQIAINVHTNINKVLKDLANKPTISFYSIDIDNICEDINLKWGEFFNCSGVPMFILFFKGKTFDTIIGGDINKVSNLIENLIQQSLP